MNLPKPFRSARAPFLLAVLAFGLLSLAACKGGTTAIDDLLEDPGSHDGKIVRVQGTVGRSIGVLGYGAYQIDDGTGQLTVLTREGGAPREGAKVGVEGEFRAAFTVGPQTLAVLMEKERVVRD
jgi:hypothetical protein